MPAHDKQKPTIYCVVRVCESWGGGGGGGEGGGGGFD